MDERIADPGEGGGRPCAVDDPVGEESFNASSAARRDVHLDAVLCGPSADERAGDDSESLLGA